MVVCVCVCDAVVVCVCACYVVVFVCVHMVWWWWCVCAWCVVVLVCVCGVVVLCVYVVWRWCVCMHVCVRLHSYHTMNIDVRELEFSLQCMGSRSKLRLSGLAVDTFACCVISLAPRRPECIFPSCQISLGCPHNCALDVIVLVYSKYLSCHFQERRRGRLFYGPQWLWEPKTQYSDI